MSVTVVLFAAAALAAAGLLTAAWRPDPLGAAAGIPALVAGIAVAGAGVSRYAAVEGAPAAGQELAVLAAVAGLALVALVTGLLGSVARTRAATREEPRRRGRRR